MNYAVIIPARNEQELIGDCIKNVLQLQPPPAYTLVVDDGSTDDTTDIVSSFPSVHYIKIDNPRYPVRGINLCWVMNDALDEIYTRFPEFDYIMKVDSDSLVPPTYFTDLLSKMKKYPRLGIASGTPVTQKIWKHQASDGAKIYRRECLHDIGYFIPIRGFDSFSIQLAKFLKWSVRSFSTIKYRQVRPFGPRCLGDWIFMGRYRKLAGYTPIYMIMLTIIHLFKSPYLIGALTMFLSYLVASLVNWKIPHMAGYYSFMKKQSWRLIIENSPFNNRC